MCALYFSCRRLKSMQLRNGYLHWLRFTAQANVVYSGQPLGRASAQWSRIQKNSTHHTCNTEILFDHQLHIQVFLCHYTTGFETGCHWPAFPSLQTYPNGLHSTLHCIDKGMAGHHAESWGRLQCWSRDYWTILYSNMTDHFLLYAKSN